MKDKERKKLIQSIYHSKEYLRARDEKLHKNPICEECLKRGIVKGDNLEVHHITPILTAPNKYQMMRLACDINNLQTLCKECHFETHRRMRQKTLYYF